MFKTILVHLDDSRRSAQRLGVATHLATDFRPELVGMYVMPAQELSPSLAALLPAEVVERRLYETGEAQHQAEALFRQAASAAGLAAIEWRAPAGDLLPICDRMGSTSRSSTTTSRISALAIFSCRAPPTCIDLIVMGAYAHTRYRELVLGGVTRTMLQSMTVPVLLSH